MSKCPIPNPDFTPWKPDTQDEYLRYAREKYIRKCGNPFLECNARGWLNHYRGRRCPECPPPHKARKNVLVALYDDGRVLGVLRLTFSEFELRVFKEAPQRYRKIGHHYLSRDGVLTIKKPSKYVRSEIHPTKRKGETPTKQDWRVRKGFERDYRKGSQYGRGRHRTAAKKQSNRLHRQWERRQVQKASWDNSISDIRKWTHDSWMWD